MIVSPHRTISPDYLREQQRLHASPRGYGQRGRKWADEVLRLVTSYQCSTVLDYGCGTGSLSAMLKTRRPALDVRDYDPAIPGKEAMPAIADLVVCTDVLEHIEAEMMTPVLAHLRALTRKALFVVIAMVPTANLLSNGEQAHISLHPVAWWKAALDAEGFRLVEEPPIKLEKQWVAVLTC